MGYNGAQIGKLRRGMRISQARLAKMLGVHRVTLARWESEEVEPCRGILYGVQWLRDMSAAERKIEVLLADAPVSAVVPTETL